MKAAEALRSGWRRATRDPFDPAVGAATIVHAGHHKVGTTWFGKILSDLGRHFGLRFEAVGDGGPERTDAHIVQFMHTRNFGDAVIGGRLIRGSHLVRDPRDVVVSAYHYHLWTKEPWAHRPDPAYGGISYQERLKSLPFDEGLAVEIRRTCGDEIRDMGEWDYRRPEFLELRYEDLMADEHGQFDRLFRHYGLSDAAREVAHRIVAANSFSARSGRRPGEVQQESHLRSGQPGEWRSVFTAEHVTLFKQLTGDIIPALGYERDSGWKSG